MPKSYRFLILERQVFESRTGGSEVFYREIKNWALPGKITTFLNNNANFANHYLIEVIKDGKRIQTYRPDECLEGDWKVRWNYAR